jgi:hypothetical protein
MWKVYEEVEEEKLNRVQSTGGIGRYSGARDIEWTEKDVLGTTPMAHGLTRLRLSKSSCRWSVGRELFKGLKTFLTFIRVWVSYPTADMFIG